MSVDVSGQIQQQAVRLSFGYPESPSNHLHVEGRREGWPAHEKTVRLRTVPAFGEHANGTEDLHPAIGKVLKDLKIGLLACLAVNGASSKACLAKAPCKGPCVGYAHAKDCYVPALLCVSLDGLYGTAKVQGL